MEGAPRGERLHAGEDLLGKQADVPPRLVVGHAAIAEDPDQHAAPGEPLVLADALVDLVGRAPHLEVGEELHEAVLAVLLDVAGEGAVILVALHRGQPGIRELVVLERRAAVAADVGLEHLPRALLVLVAGDEARDERAREMLETHVRRYCRSTLEHYE